MHILMVMDMCALYVYFKRPDFHLSFIPTISLFLHIDVMHKSANNLEQVVRGFVFKYSWTCINATVLPAKHMTNPCASTCYVIKVLLRRTEHYTCSKVK